MFLVDLFSIPDDIVHAVLCEWLNDIVAFSCLDRALCCLVKRKQFLRILRRHKIGYIPNTNFTNISLNTASAIGLWLKSRDLLLAKVEVDGSNSGILSQYARIIEVTQAPLPAINWANCSVEQIIWSVPGVSPWEDSAMPCSLVAELAVDQLQISDLPILVQYNSHLMSFSCFSPISRSMILNLCFYLPQLQNLAITAVADDGDSSVVFPSGRELPCLQSLTLNWRWGNQSNFHALEDTCGVCSFFGDMILHSPNLESFSQLGYPSPAIVHGFFVHSSFAKLKWASLASLKAGFIVINAVLEDSFADFCPDHGSIVPSLMAEVSFVQHLARMVKRVRQLSINCSDTPSYNDRTSAEWQTAIRVLPIREFKYTGGGRDPWANFCGMLLTLSSLDVRYIRSTAGLYGGLRELHTMSRSCPLTKLKLEMSMYCSSDHSPTAGIELVDLLVATCPLLSHVTLNSFLLTEHSMFTLLVSLPRLVVLTLCGIDFANSCAQELDPEDPEDPEEWQSIIGCKCRRVSLEMCKNLSLGALQLMVHLMGRTSLQLQRTSVLTAGGGPSVVLDWMRNYSSVCKGSFESHEARENESILSFCVVRPRLIKFKLPE